MLALSRLDRLLIAFLLFVGFVLASQQGSRAQCDNKCRQTKMFCWSLPGMGVRQFMNDDATCDNCTPTLVNSTCLTKNPIIPGTCQNTGMTNQYEASGCTCDCPVAVGARGEATGCKKGRLIGPVTLYECTNMAE